MVPKRRPRRHRGHPGKPTSLILAPHEVWSAEFTGHVNTGDGLYGAPLPVADGDRRFLLGCPALASTRVAEAQPVFTRVFTACGWPTRLRTDNGVPCAPNPLGRLSQLSAWWVRRGILPEGIEPGKPQQNGRHERRPRPLKAETTRPPARTRRAQPRKLARCREAFHGQRPQEALARHPPAACAAPSSRRRPTTRPPLE